MFTTFAFLIALFFGYSFDNAIGKKIHAVMRESIALMFIGLLGVFLSWYVGIAVAIAYDSTTYGMELLDIIELFFHSLWHGHIWRGFSIGYSALEILILSFQISIAVFCVTMRGYAWFANIMDREIWNTYATHAEFYQKWRERYTDTEFYTVIENGKTVTKTRQVVKERDHSPYWVAYTKYGDEITLSEAQFEQRYCPRFGNREFVYIARSGRISDDQTTGNKFVSTWDNSITSIITAAVERWYVNFIQGAPQTLLKYTGNYQQYLNLIPNYPLVINSDYGGLDVDRVKETDVVLPQGWAETVDAMISTYLALNAERKQVNVIVVLTHQPEDFFFALHQKWDGGNKNDVILLLGVNEKLEMVWGRVMSWSYEEYFREIALKRLRQISNIGQNPTKVAQIITEEIESGYQRRTMESFTRLASRALLPDYGIAIILFLIVMISFFPIAYYAHNDMWEEICFVFKSIGQFFTELIHNIQQ
ncbi:MAG: Delftia phage PhiW4 [Candidatus Parcubacteria bacterium]